MVDYHFRPEEKLKHRSSIQLIFEKGKNFHHYPVLFLYAPLSAPAVPAETEDQKNSIQAGFSVSKKKFKRAVDRNRIKRWMREAYRLQKHQLYNTHLDRSSDTLGIMMIYTGRKIPDYSTIFDAVTHFIDFYDASNP